MDVSILMHEVLPSLQSSNKKGLLIKLDMNKTFERANWSFLFSLMRRFGLYDQWISWILTLIGHPSFSILINRNDQEYFKSSRNLCQGDPLSPFLFIIMAKALGRSLGNLQAISHIKGLHINNLVPLVTHSQFADDTLISTYLNTISALDQKLTQYLWGCLKIRYKLWKIKIIWH